MLNAFRQFHTVISKSSQRILSKIKHQPIDSKIFPLSPGKDICVGGSFPGWKIERLEGQNSVYYHHLAVPNILEMPGTVEQSLELFLECTPLDQKSSLDRLLIGLHKNAVVSLMAMPKAGTSLQLCSALSGVRNLSSWSGFHNLVKKDALVYHFAHQAGADPRARAAVIVRCDNATNLERLQGFMSGIHRLHAFNTDLITIWQDIYHQCHEQVALCRRIDNLSTRKKNSAQCPEAIPAILEGLDQQIELLETQTRWRQKNTVPLNSARKIFSGYPNRIPDLQRQKRICTYYPPGIGHFPDRVPDIHLAILGGDLQRFNQILAENPQSLYERDAMGNLPIELALYCGQLEMGAIIFELWWQKPIKDQWARQRFIRAANDLCFVESQNRIVIDTEWQQERVRDYFKKQLPFLEQPLALYQAVINEDETALADAIGRESSFWNVKKQEYIHRKQQKEQLLDKVDTLGKAHIYFSRNFPARSPLHLQAIRGELPSIALCVAEKKALEAYRRAVQEIFKGQAEHHQNVRESAGKLSDRLSKILDYYLRFIVTDFAGLETFHTQSRDDLHKFLKNNVKDSSTLQRLLSQLSWRKYTDLIHLRRITANYYRHCERPDPLGENIAKEIRHPEQSEGSPDVREMSRKARHDVLLWEDAEKDVFDIATQLLMLQQASLQYQDILKVERDQQFPLSLSQRFSRQEKAEQSADFAVLRNCSARDDRALNSVISSSLLSYEKQDPWGYTPLLLAVVHNQIDYVKVFFEHGLVSHWILPLNSTQQLYYTLLDHARSREMTALLLHYYTNPEQSFSWFDGVERKLPMLLMYHHNLSRDTHDQSLMDFIALGHSGYDIALLEEILKHREEPVQAGPYDPSMPLAVQRLFIEHNQRLERKKEQQKNRPKLISTQIGFFESPGVVSELKLVYEGKEKTFYSVIKKVSALTLSEKKKLAAIFASQFEISQSEIPVIDAAHYFEAKVLSNSHYIFDIFYDEQRNVTGFFCFQLKRLEHPEYGDCNAIYASIAACEGSRAGNGLLTAAFRMVLAAKKISDEAGLPLVFYGRFGRPGIAYLAIPELAMVSTKYHKAQGLVQYIAGEFGNTLEANGSSIPPVQSKALVSAVNARIEEYRYLLDERIAADPKASLPLIFDVDEAVYEQWLDKLFISAGVREPHILQLVKNYKCLMDSTASIKACL